MSSPVAKNQCYACRGIGHWADNCPIKPKSSPAKRARGQEEPAERGQPRDPAIIQKEIDEHLEKVKQLTSELAVAWSRAASRQQLSEMMRVWMEQEPAPQ